MTDWIQGWFSSKYYYMLYKHRDPSEAKLFLDNLLSFLKLPSGSTIIDYGCGRGRHCIYLAEKGFKVTGIDICEKNILEAKKSKNKNLDFYIHDMRNFSRKNYYDVVLNIFTSFGYFEKDTENNKAIKSTADTLKKGGWFVLDFMNAEKEIRELVPSENVKYNGLKFSIERYIQGDFIIKKIVITDKDQKHQFTERVKTYRKKDFEKFFTANKLEIVHLFGDYELNPFDSASSERLILIGKKI